MVATRADTLRDKPQLCEAVTEAPMEAAALQLREPDRALDMFVRQVPEIGITSGGRENARLSQGLMQRAMPAPEATQNGFGWTDMDRWPTMTDLAVEFGAPPDARRPEPETLISNRFAGRLKLSGAEWEALRGSLAPCGRMLG